MAIDTARKFFFAINEATRIEGIADPSEDAIEFLEIMSENIFRALDTSGATGRQRDNMIFWEGMLKGVQLRLSKDRMKEVQQNAEISRILQAPTTTNH
jgi:hypothetical protein